MEAVLLNEIIEKAVNLKPEEQQKCYKQNTKCKANL